MRYTLAGCSRMRVGEGSSEKKEIEKIIKIVLKTSRNRSRKRDVKHIKKSSKKHPKKEVKMKKKTIKNRVETKMEKRRPRLGAEDQGWERKIYRLGWGDLQINKITNKLTNR